VRTKFDFKGGRELEAALKELGDPKLIRRVGSRALDKSAEIIAAKARQLAPIHDGYLRASIKVGSRAMGRAQRRFKRSEVGGDILERYVGIDERVRPAQNPKTTVRRKRVEGGSSGGSVAFYSQVVEFGLANNPAQPFMRPAWEQKKDEAQKSIAGNLKEAIEHAAKLQVKRKAKSE
jgi:HK97 gp10 family phage protein